MRRGDNRGGEVIYETLPVVVYAVMLRKKLAGLE